GRPAWRERHSLVAEVHEVVLELRRPLRGEGVFDAGPGGPANARVGEVDGAREGVDVGRELVVRPGNTALAVNEPAIERDAEAAGERRGPVHIGVEGRAGRRHDAEQGRSTVDAGPREVTFRAQHELPDLIVQADLTTAEETVRLARYVEET